MVQLSNALLLGTDKDSQLDEFYDDVVDDIVYESEIEPLSPEEEAELHPEGEGTLSLDLAMTIVGEGKTPHILDLSAQWCRPDLLYEDGDPTKTVYKPAYLASLASLKASPPAPPIFYQEHARERMVLDLLNEVYEAIVEKDYSGLISKVEIMAYKYGRPHWITDPTFEDKSKEDQAATVNFWLEKLKLEADKLLSRPHYWILRTDPEGLDDQECWDSNYVPEVDINDEESPAELVEEEAAVEEAFLAQAFEPMKTLARHPPPPALPAPPAPPAPPVPAIIYSQAPPLIFVPVVTISSPDSGYDSS